MTVIPGNGQPCPKKPAKSNENRGISACLSIQKVHAAARFMQAIALNQISASPFFLQKKRLFDIFFY
jgi:hypothetical protein